MSISGDIQLTVVTRQRADVLATYALPGLIEIAAEGVAVLIVDQSSDDRTEKLTTGTDVQYSRTTTRGLSSGRNFALRTSRSTWIAFTDDDMLPTPTWLKAISSAISNMPEVSAVLGRGIRPGGRLMSGGPPGLHRWPTDVFTLGSGYSFAVARAPAIRVGGFHPRFGAGAWFGAAEDTLMLYRLLRGGYTILCDDKVRIEHPEWRSANAQAWRQFRYGRGTAALALVSLGEGDRKTVGRAYARMIRQGRRIGGLLLSSQLQEATSQVCYLIGAISALDTPVVLGLNHWTSRRSLADESRVAGDGRW